MSEKLRVLVLDDSEIVLNMMVLVLAEAGFEAFSANSLVEFELLLSSADPHIVLTDIQMPEITGDDVCRVLKSKMDTHLVPVVLFSTIEDKELAELAEHSGADGYVSKNAGPGEIVRVINKLTEEIIF